jgi:hypothetical protein
MAGLPGWFTGAVNHNEVVFLKIQGPTGLSTVELFGGVEIP